MKQPWFDEKMEPCFLNSCEWWYVCKLYFGIEWEVNCTLELNGK